MDAAPNWTSFCFQWHTVLYSRNFVLTHVVDQDGKDLCQNKDFSRFELDVKMLLKDESLYYRCVRPLFAGVCVYVFV